MNMEFLRKLPIPKDIKEEFPLPNEYIEKKAFVDSEIKAILSGKDKRLLIIVGPCSADNEDSALEYLSKLKPIAEKVKDKLLIIPRLYTNKPRTIGDGYKGMLHQPNPSEKPDMLKGIIATRKLHLDSIKNFEFFSADEMLYPEYHRYLSDLLSYTVVGARSVENQQHRLTASGLDIPVGMKNPTSGDLSIMLNSIETAEHPHEFIYRGWEVQSKGNPYAHAVIRGYVDKFGVSHSNYKYDDLTSIFEQYKSRNLSNMALIVDTNHSNSNKDCFMQPPIVDDVLASIKKNNDVKSMVKGFMIESYLLDGSQNIDGKEKGKSITDPCLGIEKTEKLLYNLAEKV